MEDGMMVQLLQAIGKQEINLDFHVFQINIYLLKDIIYNSI